MGWVGHTLVYVAVIWHGSPADMCKHPHLSPEDTWKKLFEQPPKDSFITEAAKETENLDQNTTSFKPSLEPAHREILRLLRENEPATITIVAIGPLTNCALAAAEDPETFLRAKELVTMGGAVDAFGNVRGALMLFSSVLFLKKESFVLPETICNPVLQTVDSAPCFKHVSCRMHASHGRRPLFPVQ